MIPPIRRRLAPVECATPPPLARYCTFGPALPAPTPRTRTRRAPALPHHRRLFGGRLVVFPGGDIMKAVRGVVLSAFPRCDTRCCQGSWGAGPVVMARPSRLRVRRGGRARRDRRAGRRGRTGWSGGRFRRPRSLSAPTARPAWWDGVSHVVTRPARLDHLRAVGPLAFRWTTVFREPGGPTAFKWSNRTQVVQRNISGPSRRAPP